MRVQRFTSTIADALLSYSTVKLVQVPHTSIAIIYRLLQLVILGYIIGYIVVWKKGYQRFEEPHGTSVIKVKGIARAKPMNLLPDQNLSSTIWDTAEYEIPPIENNAFFIATHQTVTYGQSLGVCPTSLDDKLFCNASSTALCKKDKPTPSTFGILTGLCVQSHENKTLEVCEMNGWCPVESSESVDYQMDVEDLKTFTIFIKTLVTFTSLNRTLRSIKDNTNFSCRFDGTTATQTCPIIPISYILDGLQTNRSALLLEGGLIEIQQDWTCNFDQSIDKCIPNYHFSLLQAGDDKQSPGINYRFGQKYRVNGTDYRTLTKVFGLRFIVTVTGRGGLFNIVNLFLAIGSGIGFMVIASIVSDAILMYIHKSRERYRRGKFDVCSIDEAQQPLT